MIGHIAIVVILATSVASLDVKVQDVDCGVVGQLIPDPKNCSRFYECTFSGWVGLFCYPGLQFNPATQECDLAENVQCEIDLNTKLTNLEPCQKVDQLKPDVKNCSRFYECTLAGWVGEACNPGLEFNPDTLQCDYPANVKCATENTKYDVDCGVVGQLIPDPKNCSRFYECTYSGWVGLFCYPGLQFNPATQECDLAENVQCEIDLNTKLTNLEPCQKVDQLKPDVKNCSRFYECTLAGWVGEACNPGLEFNPDTLQCDYPANVKCATENTKYVNLEPCQKVDQLKPDVKNCSRFYECTLAGWVGEACNPGLEFNPDTLQCDYPANVKCATENTKHDIELEPCLEVDQLIPDPKNCSRFYECTLNGWVGLFCYPGLEFNPKTLQCDYPENVQCTNESRVKISREEQAKLEYSKNIQKIKNQQPSCTSNNYDELFPDPSNCGRFLECSSLGLVSMPCPDGLFFNRQTKLCDYAWKVEC
ncbi:chitin-binding domain protein cbd-1-like isoform X2 [Harmonia axyridis]|uniref:chitin-binding domain protein cbd-1-like isoform X2 n=1 Tax=Harmonia axyridis TaxID=115357 RepID=UPI001E275169|nr:chitin-binding domain protein cbd-1-like isoform X2 [Harmonia axyridis]